MNFNKIVVYDTETTGVNPEECQIVQLASVIINPRLIEIVPGSEFNSWVRPLTFDEPDFIIKHQEVIAWHAKNYKCSPEEILAKWNAAPSQKDVFTQFQQYLLRYHTRSARQNKFSAPIRAGHNIIRFDDIIMKRLCKTYGAVDKDGEMTLFHPRDVIDLLNISFMFFENLNEPKSYSMDNLKDFFGIKSAGHDAMQDVIDTAEIIMRFMRLCRRTAANVKFKGACGEKRDDTTTN